MRFTEAKQLAGKFKELLSNIDAFIKECRLKLHHMYMNMPLKRKLTVIFSSQIIIVLIFLGFFNTKIFEDIFQNKAINYTHDILTAIEFRLLDYTNSLSLVSQDVLYDRTIYNLLNQSELNDDVLERYENETKVNNILKRIILTRTEIESICLFMRDDQYYFSDYNGRRTGVRSLYPVDAIQEKARLSHGKVTWYLDTQNQKVNHVFLARTVYSQDGIKEVGLLVFLVKKEFFETLYQNFLTQANDNIIIVASSGDVIISKNQEKMYIPDAELLDLVRNKNGSVIDQRTKTLISYVSIQQPDWSVISFVSLNTLLRDIKTIQIGTVLLAIIVLIGMLVLSIKFSKDVIHPVNQLVMAIAKAKKEKGIDHVYKKPEDELTIISKNFNEMSSEIEQLTRWVYHEQITRKDAEIKALQSQINPHFLFNTLESINWMAQLNDVPEISKVITALSSLLEAGICRDDRLITLEEEICYVENYIMIIKTRFEDQFNFVKEIDPSTLEIEIPRLLIQPIVENAIKHGLDSVDYEGIIALKTWTEKDKLYIQVMDNGKGISPKNLQSLNEKLSVDSSTYFNQEGANEYNSIGIENVNRRIKLIYGDECGVSFESEEGSYTKVILKLSVA